MGETPDGHGGADGRDSGPAGEPVGAASPPPRRVAWYRTAGGKVATAAGGVLLAVVTTVTVTRVNGWVNPPPTSSTSTPGITPANPTTTSPATRDSPAVTTLVPAAGYAGPLGTGWSIGGTPSLFQGSPLTLTASLDPSKACQGQPGWVFGQPARELAPLPYSGNSDAWALANGGVPASGSYLAVDVQSSPGQAVIVDGVGVTVVHRSTPTGRVWAQLGGGCGGLVPSFFSADLDAGGDVRAVAGQDANGRTVVPVPFPHTLDDTDRSEQWRIELVTKGCDCSVVPYLDYTADGRTGRIEITNRGGPWRVTPTKGTTPVARDAQDGVWTAYGKAP